MCVIACATAAFCVGKVSLHTPQPYKLSLAFARIAFGFVLFFAVGFVAGFFFAGAFAGFSDFGFGSVFGVSVPWTVQKRQPLQATPAIAAFPADDGLLCSDPSSSL